MIDPRTQALLQHILRRASRSLLQYVSEAYPWVGQNENDVIGQVRRVIEEERQAIEQLARFLRRQHIGLPYLGAYPGTFMSMNYVSLDHLLQVLCDYQRKMVAELERNHGPVSDPAARAEIDKLLTLARQHAKTLDALAAAHPEVAVK
jgi:hypothetical protein